MQLQLIVATTNGNSSSGSKTSSGKEHDIPAENPTSNLNQNMQHHQISQLKVTSQTRSINKIQLSSTKIKAPRIQFNDNQNSNSPEEDMMWVSPVANHNDARVNFPLERLNNFKNLADISLQLSNRVDLVHIPPPTEIKRESEMETLQTTNNQVFKKSFTSVKKAPTVKRSTNQLYFRRKSYVQE